MFVDTSTTHSCHHAGSVISLMAVVTCTQHTPLQVPLSQIAPISASQQFSSDEHPIPSVATQPEAKQQEKKVTLRVGSAAHSHTMTQLDG
jgi:hypothetical protein